MSDNAPIDYFDDLQPVAAQPATLELLSELALKSVALQKEIDVATVALEEKTAELGRLQRQTIPDIMDRLAMESFKLSDGSTLSVKKDVKASIKEENKPAAFKWLRDHNFDGIIKASVSASFSKGEYSQAEEAVKVLSEHGISAALAETVHPATLKSFVKEQLEEGNNIPIDTFGIFEFKQATIKLPRTKK